MLRTNSTAVLAIRYDWRNTSMVTLHNFSSGVQNVKLKVGCTHDDLLLEVFDGRHSRKHNDGIHHIRMEGYAWRWFRVGAADNTLDRSDLTLTPDMRVR